MHWTLANADSSLPSKPCRRVPTIPIPGATLDCFLTITSSQHANLQTLSQIWPRSLNHVVGGASNSIYLVVNDIGFPEGLLLVSSMATPFCMISFPIHKFWSSHPPRIANASTASLTPIINALESLTLFTQIPVRIRSFQTHTG